MLHRLMPLSTFPITTHQALPQHLRFGQGQDIFVRRHVDTTAQSPIRFSARISPNAMHCAVTSFERETGFPDLALTSRKIEEAVAQAIEQVCQEKDIKVLYAGYDPTCSVARGVAVPGSDLDGLTIVVNKKARPFKKTLVQRLSYEPAYRQLIAFNPKSDDSQGIKVINTREIDIYKNHILKREAVAPAKDWDAICRVRQFMALVAYGKPLREDYPIKWKDLAELNQKDSRREPDYYSPLLKRPPKAKYIYRQRLAELYPTLTLAEKWIIIKTQQDNTARRYQPKLQPSVPLEFSPQHDYYAELCSLRDKGLLIQLDPESPELIAAWSPLYIGQEIELESRL